MRPGGEEIPGEDARAAPHIQDMLSTRRLCHLKKESAFVFLDDFSDGSLEPGIVFLRPVIKYLCHVFLSPATEKILRQD